MSDLIDRQAVIDLLKQMRKDGDMVPWEGKDVFARIRKLPTIQPEKAQLSQEDATSDLISKTETVEHLRRMLESTVPNTDYDEGFIDGVEFGISTVSTMPTIQPQSTTGQLNDSAQSTNLIDRQAAIDIERNATVDTNPSHFEAHQKFTQFMDDAEVSSFGRWQWANGFNTALTAVGIDLKKLPSAQPERKKGEWLPDNNNAYEMRFVCSCCKESEVVPTIGFTKYKPLWDFCPNCGADMRGEKDG